MIALLVAAALFVASPVPVGRGSGHLALADVDRDGNLDLVTQHLLQKCVRVRFGDGKGGFARGTRIDLEYEPAAIAVGDLNGDGNPDLAIPRKDAAHEFVEILHGDGKGAFRRAATIRTSPAMKYYKPILRIADVDRDGRLDVVIANGRRNTIEIARGGTGSVTTKQLDAGGDFYTFELGDVDADGRLDFVTASERGVAIHHGSGGITRVAVAPNARLAAVADTDGDRRADIVLTHARSTLVTILHNENGRRFTTRTIDLALPAFAVVVAGDTLVMTVVEPNAPFASRIVVVRGEKAQDSFAAGPGAYRLAVGDVDEDGHPDIAASSFEGDAVTLLRTKNAALTSGVR